MSGASGVWTILTVNFEGVVEKACAWYVLCVSFLYVLGFFLKALALCGD